MIPKEVRAVLPRHRYLIPITESKRLLILRVPVTGRGSRAGVTSERIHRELLVLLKRLGISRDALHSVDGYDPWYTRWNGHTKADRDAAEFFARLDRAFDGDESCVPAFELWTLGASGEFEAVRPALAKPEVPR